MIAFGIRIPTYSESCQVLLIFRSDFKQVLVGIFDHFQDMSKFEEKIRIYIFYGGFGGFSEKQPFF